MLSVRTVLALVLVGTAVSLPRAEVAIPPFADRLAGTVGINVHLHYTDTPYDNFGLVRTRLAELGVRHLRDGLINTTWQPYYDRHKALGAMGLKGTFIASPDTPDEVLRGYPSRLSGMFEGYEAPNEYDVSGVDGWTSSLWQSLVQLRALKKHSNLSSYPIYGPSLTSGASYAALGDVSAYIDAANLHNYMAGRHPGTAGWGDGGYGSIDWNIAVAKRYAPGRPIVTTETGYWDDFLVPDSVPAVVAGRYMPRLLLEQFRKGVQRTYIYELIDDPQSGIAARSGFGLVWADGSPKPSFRAVSNLLRVFSDPGPHVRPKSFIYNVDGGDGDVRQMAFQKRDGTMLLAVWVEANGFDLGTRQAVAVPPQTVRISTPTSLPLARTYRWLEDGSVFEDTAGAGQVNLSVTLNDALTVLQFGSVRQAVP